MSGAINGDLSRRTFVDTTQLEWVASPSHTVWRKRFHLVGPAESGQVSSIVRYEPGAQFPAHEHPDGEEILVLEGVFSDEHGDWPAGTYLLNPEGFRHAPFSRSGCLLLVKLRQSPGLQRHHVVIDTRQAEWEPATITGIAQLPLYSQQGFADEMRLERWAPGADPGVRLWAGGVELFVLEGEFADENGSYTAGCWLRLPIGGYHSPHSRGGCTLYAKHGGLQYLKSAPD